MNEPLHEDELFKTIDFTDKAYINYEYINCTFRKCLFLKTDFSNSTFMDCVFVDCNLSGTVFDNASLKNVDFTQSKVMGINFGKCTDFLFSVSFSWCILDYSSFFQKKMQKTIFRDCSMKEVTFSEVDLTEAVFENCDLLNASFIKVNLQKADFRSATWYSLDPELNTIKYAKFSRWEVIGLLAKYPIMIE